MALDGFIHLFIENFNDNRQRITLNNLRCRNLRDVSNPFEIPDRLFLKLFRLNKETCQYLIDSLSPHLIQHSRITRIPVHLRILLALNFFGQGSYQTGIGLGWCFAVSQPIVSRCLGEVCRVINQQLTNQWIRFPSTHEEKQIIKQGFREHAACFENCLGIVDGSLIRIVSPPAHHPVYPGPIFYCRKNFYAINIQVICDHNKKILAINARFPGSVHDSAIWMMSRVREELEREYINNNSQNYLIGDSGYPLEPWLLVPVNAPPPDSPHSRFNTRLSSLRVKIEHSIGLLKNRFRCIHGQRALYYSPNKVTEIIHSCVILHNIARTRMVEMPDDEDILDENPENEYPRPIVNDWYNAGEARREEIIHRFFI